MKSLQLLLCVLKMFFSDIAQHILLVVQPLISYSNETLNNMYSVVQLSEAGSA